MLKSGSMLLSRMQRLYITAEASNCTLEKLSLGTTLIGAQTAAATTALRGARDLHTSVVSYGKRDGRTRKGKVRALKCILKEDQGGGGTGI